MNQNEHAKKIMHLQRLITSYMFGANNATELAEFLCPKIDFSSDAVTNDHIKSICDAAVEALKLRLQIS